MVKRTRTTTSQALTGCVEEDISDSSKRQRILEGDVEESGGLESVHEVAWGKAISSIYSSALSDIGKCDPD